MDEDCSQMLRDIRVQGPPRISRSKEVRDIRGLRDIRVLVTSADSELSLPISFVEVGILGHVKTDNQVISKNQFSSPQVRVIK